MEEYNTNEYMNVKDAATYLGISVQTLYIWTYNKKIKVYKLRNRFNRYKKSDLDKLLHIK